MIRLVTSVLTVSLLAAACGLPDSDAVIAPVGSIPDAPVEVISPEDLEALLPTILDVPDGWERSSINDEAETRLCDRVEALGSIQGLGLPSATVEYESSNGSMFRDASIAVFGKSSDGNDRLDRFVAVLSDPDCQDLSFNLNRVSFVASLREADTGNPNRTGRLATVSLGEDIEGFDEGTAVVQILSTSVMVGRCSIAVSMLDASIFPIAPTEAEIDQWISPIITAAHSFEPCEAQSD